MRFRAARRLVSCCCLNEELLNADPDKAAASDQQNLVASRSFGFKVIGFGAWKLRP